MLFILRGGYRPLSPSYATHMQVARTLVSSNLKHNLCLCVGVLNLENNVKLSKNVERIFLHFLRLKETLEKYRFQQITTNKYHSK